MSAVIRHALIMPGEISDINIHAINGSLIHAAADINAWIFMLKIYLNMDSTKDIHVPS